MSRELNGDTERRDNPYMVNIDDFMELEDTRKFEVLLTMIANINQTLEAMGEDLYKLKPKPAFVYEYNNTRVYTPNIPIRDKCRAEAGAGDILEITNTPRFVYVPRENAKEAIRTNTPNTCEKCGFPPDLCMCDQYAKEVNVLYSLKPKGCVFTQETYNHIESCCENCIITKCPKKPNTPKTKVSIWKQKFPIRETPNTPEDIFRYRSQ